MAEFKLETVHNYRFGRTDSIEPNRPEFLQATYSIKYGSEGYRFHGLLIDNSIKKVVNRLYFNDRDELQKTLDNLVLARTHDFERALVAHKIEMSQDKPYPRKKKSFQSFPRYARSTAFD